jgi:hypothetical protein
MRMLVSVEVADAGTKSGTHHVLIIGPTMTDVEAGLEKVVPGGTDSKGQPANGLGFARAAGFGADCCSAAPSVLEFDANGDVLRAWGGPSDPGFIGGKCRRANHSGGWRRSAAAMCSVRRRRNFGNSSA